MGYEQTKQGLSITVLPFFIIYLFNNFLYYFIIIQ